GTPPAPGPRPARGGPSSGATRGPTPSPGGARPVRRRRRGRPRARARSAAPPRRPAPPVEGRPSMANSWSGSAPRGREIVVVKPSAFAAGLDPAGPDGPGADLEQPVAVGKRRPFHRGAGASGRALGAVRGAAAGARGRRPRCGNDFDVPDE